MGNSAGQPHQMNPVMKFSPGDNAFPSEVLCSCPSSISTATKKGVNGGPLNGKTQGLRSSTSQSSSVVPLGRPKAIERTRSSPYTHHQTRLLISFWSELSGSLLGDLYKPYTHDEMLADIS